MPAQGSLTGIPVISAPEGTSHRGEPSTAAGGAAIPALTTASLTNLLSNTNPSLASAMGYIGDGLPPVPPALAAKIRRGAFVDMGELLPEFWAMTKEDTGMKSDTKVRWNRKITDIFTWLQCFGTYVSVLTPLHPERVPKLMAYMTTIIRASQDYTGLAWVRYDIAFRRQAALTGNMRWSMVNATLYTICFTAATKATTRCELCFATTHTEKECAQQGHPDPGLLEQMKAMEMAVLAKTAPGGYENQQTSRQPREPSGEPWRLWNRGSCTYPKCHHSHVCSMCGGNHPARFRPMQAPQPGRVPQDRPPPRGPASSSQGVPRPLLAVTDLQL